MNGGKKYFLIWCCGALLYGLVEVIARGYTHWTMAITGGFTLIVLYLINRALRGRSILLRALAGSAAITAIELTVGVIVNLVLRWNVWDYSDEMFNFLGQICPKISLYWFALCVPVMIACDLADMRLGSENHEEAT